MPYILAKRFPLADHNIPAPLTAESGIRPQWLLVPYIAPTWSVDNGANKSPIDINFDVVMPGGTRLTDYPNLYNSIRRITYGIRSGPLAFTSSGEIQSQTAANFITLARWMVQNSIYNFSELTKGDADEYAALAAYGTDVICNSESVLTRYVQKLTEVIHASFCDGDSVSDKREKVTAILPVRVHARCHYLNREKLLSSAGLSGMHGNPALANIMDDLCAEFGLYLSPARLRRRQMANSLIESAGPTDVSQPSDSQTSKKSNAKIADDANDCQETADSRSALVPQASNKVLSRPTAAESASATHPDFTDDQPLSWARIAALLKPFDLLYLHRRYIADAMVINPFAGTSSTKVAKKLGKSVGRTLSVPFEQAKVFLERCIRWVIDYAPALLAVHGGKVPSLPPTDAVCQPFPLLEASRQDGVTDEIQSAELNRTGITLPIALNYLMTACAVVIAAFTARRASEILSLKIRCIERDDRNVPWLKIFIAKTLRRESLIPTSEAVVKAVEVLKKLSRTARAVTKTDYLFQYQLLGEEQVRGISESKTPVFDLNTNLRRFGYFIDVPALPNGTRWTFRPHQFRRLFAIVYIWVYHLSDWGALAFWLRHFDIEMTKRYTTDEELGHVLSSVDKQRTADILAQAAVGKVAISGTNGERLKAAAQRIHQRLLQKVSVVSERKLAQRMTRLVELGNLSLRALPWAYCATSGVKQEKCKCASADTLGPNYARASVETCHGCPHEFRSDVFLPFVNGSIKTHLKIAESPNLPSLLRDASRRHLITLNIHVKSLQTQS